MINVQDIEFDHIWSNISHNFSLSVPRIKVLFVNFLSPYVLPVFSLLGVIIFGTLLRKFVLPRIFLIKEKSVLLEITPPALTDKSAHTTKKLFEIIYDIGHQQTMWEKLLGKRIVFSLEIVSTREQGIRYLIRTTEKVKTALKQSITAYLPYAQVKEVPDYVNPLEQKNAHILEFKLKRHFAYPLVKQNMLDEHDPVAYIAGNMTKLAPGELIAFQIVLSPTKTREADIISDKILRNEDVLGYLDRFRFPWYVKPVEWITKGCIALLRGISWILTDFFFTSKEDRYAHLQNLHLNQLIVTKARPARMLSSFEEELVGLIQEKVDQLLFQTTLRAYICVNNSEDRSQRIRGIRSSLAPFTMQRYQELHLRYNGFPPVIDKLRDIVFKKRLLSFLSNQSESLLSVSEIADLYHFPYTRTTKTENIAKVYSKQLPAPVSLKNGRKLHVIFGENIFDGTRTPIGLTDDERATHMYIIGRTGSGKTTLMFTMSKCDIERGAGMAFVDPHGDVSEDLLLSIPDARINDVIYLNPMDLKYPIHINLLELTSGLDEDAAELEKEVVCEGVVSLFRKVFSKDEQANAHRIEYILRNTIHTAFAIEGATIFTLYQLLNNPTYQKEVVKQLKDENLKNFWNFEFGRAGNFQVVKMVGGVTAKVGRFLFSPTAKRILEEPVSTINFDDILNQGKILICNFSQGNLGEDTARLLGTTILTKIQQAALKRAQLPENKRKPFYLYVDEFQNFATNSFIKMLSEGRKYGLSVCIAEQSTSQQDEQNVVYNILANVTNVICFRSANPVDEELMLNQFAPVVQKGDIVNLPKYQFYIKISGGNATEEPFSGQTLFIPVKRDQEKFNSLIAASRKNWASEYKRTTEKQEKIVISGKDTSKKNDQNIKPEGPKKVLP